MPKYHLCLDIYRNVRRPDAGRHAYTVQPVRFRFPFGKGGPYKNWLDAVAAARAYWEKYEREASKISVFRVTNAGNGVGVVVANTERLFDTEFDFPHPQHHPMQGTSSG